MLGKAYEGQDCLVARALEIVGERWTLLIVRDAFFGVRRYSDFVKHLDIPREVLSERLKGLVRDGVMERRADPQRGGREFYELTQAGRDLWPVLYALRSWSARHRSPGGTRRAFTHATCETELGHDGACPSCGTIPRAQDVVMSMRPGARRRRDDPVTIALLKPHRLLEPLAVGHQVHRETSARRARQPVPGAQ